MPHHPRGPCRGRRPEDGYRVGLNLVRGHLTGSELGGPWNDPKALSQGWIATTCACCENPLYERVYPYGRVWICLVCLAHVGARSLEGSMSDAADERWWWEVLKSAGTVVAWLCVVTMLIAALFMIMLAFDPTL